MTSSRGTFRLGVALTVAALASPYGASAQPGGYVVRTSQGCSDFTGFSACNAGATGTPEGSFSIQAEVTSPGRGALPGFGVGFGSVTFTAKLPVLAGPRLTVKASLWIDSALAAHTGVVHKIRNSDGTPSSGAWVDGLISASHSSCDSCGNHAFFHIVDAGYGPQALTDIAMDISLSLMQAEGGTIAAGDVTIVLTIFGNASLGYGNEPPYVVPDNGTTSFAITGHLMNVAT